MHNLEGPLGVDQLNIWANAFELHHPVIDDAELAISDLLWPDDPGRPKSVLIGPGAQIVTYSPTIEQVEAALE